MRDTACRACSNGVARSHLLSYEREGALLEELFTHDGSGTLIAQNPYEQARAADIEDIASILELIRPLEEVARWSSARGRGLKKKSPVS